MSAGVLSQEPSALNNALQQRRPSTCLKGFLDLISMPTRLGEEHFEEIGTTVFWCGGWLNCQSHAPHFAERAVVAYSDLDFTAQLQGLKPRLSVHFGETPSCPSQYCREKSSGNQVTANDSGVVCTSCCRVTRLRISPKKMHVNGNRYSDHHECA